MRVAAPPASGRFEPESLNDTNEMEIHVFVNEARRQAVLVAKLDNLGKGASGAAVQNLELMLGAAGGAASGGNSAGRVATLTSAGERS